jgi:hypothetical protein
MLAPLVSVVPTASPCCLTPHPAADDRAPSHPGPPISRAVPRRPDSAALHCRAATRRPPRRGWAGRCLPMPRHYPTPRLNPPPRSPPFPPRVDRAPPNPPLLPPRRPPLKGKPTTADEFALPRAAIPPLHSAVALPPPPSPLPRATGPPRRSPEPSHPRRRPPPPR